VTTDVGDVWARYKAAPTPEDREVLIVAHIPLVRYVASRMMPSLHSSVERQDLVSYGMFGLMDAIEKFDLDAGVKFSTFATYRIRGAITDEMRGQAWEPRSVRAKSRVVVQAMTDLELKLGRPPTEDEVATHVDMSVADLRRLGSDRRMSVVSSINRTIGNANAGLERGEFTVADTLVAVDDGGVAEEAALFAQRLAEAIPRLPEQERVLLQLLYATPDKSRVGMSLKDIAVVLQVTESWISLLHTRAMIVLQRTLAGQAI
jgi:RNA polymerase sigma factor FliA